MNLSASIMDPEKPHEFDRPAGTPDVRSSKQTPALLVFSDDWGRHPSSCQHLVGQLLPDFEVCWVNTIGMRPPRLDWSTVRRGTEKLKQWLGPATADQDALPDNLRVVRPLMWPWIRRRFDRAVNRRLLLKRLRREIERLARPVVAITTIPVVADLMEELPVDRWVYYCVDDFSTWPGLEQGTLQSMERTLVARADRLLAASESLQNRLSADRESVGLLTHGIDLDHWTGPRLQNESAVLDGVPAPRATFWGLIDQRMDVEWLSVLSERMSDGQIVLVGPENNPDPTLARVKRLRMHGSVSYAALPSIAAESDVLIMPYADLPVTQAMQPLKLMEYLATDRPVVVRDLPANRPWADCLDLATSASEFANLVCRRIASGLPPEQRAARRRVAAESWASKARTFCDLALDGYATSRSGAES